MIDFRSDTVTKPTHEMRLAMMNAKVGDDVLGEDPTVNELERISADKLGKEAAIFVPSGTFGNQLAVLTHTKRGDEIIVQDNNHIVQYEVAASAVISGVQLRTVVPNGNYLVWDDIKKYIRTGYDIHQPETGMIELQNTLGNGDVVSSEEMKNIYDHVKPYNIPIHLDGARIFNAAVYLDVEVREIVRYCDSIMFCLSKGLGAPVGSILAGSEEFIFKTRKNRKLMGGGMRQSGILAAPGIIAVEEMTKRLHLDHAKAKRLAESFSKFPIFDINQNDVKTNIFFLKFNTENEEIPLQFVNLLKENNILVYPPRFGEVRFVTHLDIQESDIDKFIEIIPNIVDQL